MRPTALVLFWLRSSFKIEDSRLRRMDGIRGARLMASDPTVRVFSERGWPSVRG